MLKTDYSLLFLGGIILYVTHSAELKHHIKYLVLFWISTRNYYTTLVVSRQLNLIVINHCFPIQKALHLRSTRTFKDDKGVLRKNGEEWLVTMAETEAHIPNVYEEVKLGLNYYNLTSCIQEY